MNHRHSKRIGGFNLIAISIILTVSAIIFASTLPSRTASDSTTKAISSIQKLQTIEERTKAFMSAKRRRPCPADGQYDVNDANFGVEAATPGTCVGGTPSAPLGPDAGSTFIVGGVVPVKTLGLPSEYAFDEWGRRFTYVVDKRTTLATSCIGIQASTPPGTGMLKIQNKNAAGTVVSTDSIMYAYISHGPSGFGAWPTQGASSPAGRINTGITDADKLTNAGVNSSFTYNTTNFTNTKVKKEPTSSFDDVVYYADSIKNTCCMGPDCVQQGFIMPGLTANGYLGYSEAFGDVNGDGIPDMIVTTATTAFMAPSYAYVVFGQRGKTFNDPLLPLVPAILTGTNGFKIFFGYNKTNPTVAIADVSGHAQAGSTLKDIIITSGGANKLFVIYGQPSSYSWPSSFDATTGSTKLNGTNGSVFQFPTNTNASYSVAVGDINGDGINDIVIGDWEYVSTNPVNGLSQAGAVYVFFGGSSAFGHSYTSPFVVSSGTYPSAVSGFDGTNGFAVNGVASGSQLGASVAVADINNDGFGDVVIWENGGGGGGFVDVIFGQKQGYPWATPWPAAFNTNPTTLQATLNGTNGFTISGLTNTDAGSILGVPLTSMDLNNDGIPDLVISDFRYNSMTGRVAVIFGQHLGGPTWTGTNGTWPNSSINTLAVGKGIVFNGEGSNYVTGGSLAPAGDFNGDSIADLIIGAGGASSGVGSSYIVYGSATAWTATNSFNLSSLNGTNGLRIDGCTTGSVNPNLGIAYGVGSAVSAGDINKDGVSDIVVSGARLPYTYSGSTNTNAGIAYILFGNKRHPYTTPFNLCNL
jgi:hypothetical protein